MKKAIVSIFLILICYFGFAQYPLTQNIGSSSTLVTVPANGGLLAGLIPRAFTDTTAASLTNLKFYDGAIIKTTTPIVALWYRYLAATQWVQILPSGGATGQYAWLVGGNGIFTSPTGNVTFGTTAGTHGIDVKTGNTTRFIVPSGGIGINTVNTVPIGINSVTKELEFSTAGSSGTVTSVGLTVPSPSSPAFTVTGSPVTGAGTLAIGANGTTSQYIRGDGSLATTPVLTNEWHLTGNAGTTAGSNFLGTTDAADLMFKINSVKSGNIGRSGKENISMGYSSFLSEGTLTKFNTAIGAYSLLNSASSSVNNIALGYYAGAYATNLDNRVYINSLNRTDLSGDTTKSPIYIAQDATAANQRAYINAKPIFPYVPTGVGTKALRIDASGNVTSTDTTAATDSIYGDFINSTFNATSIPSGLVSTGGTFAYATTGLTMSAGNNTYFDNRIETVAYTTSQNLSQQIVFTVTAKDSGVFIGRYSHSSAGKLGYTVTLKRTGTSTARLEYQGNAAYVNLGVLAYSADIAWTDGQTYRIYLTANTGAITARVDRYDTLTNYVLESSGFQYKIKWNGNSALGEAYPNVGSPYFGSLSGTYRVRTFVETHYDSRYADVVFMGTSVETRYNESSLQNHFAHKAFQGTPLRVSIFAGPGDQLLDLRTNFVNTRLSHPRYVIVEFINDGAAAIRTGLPPLLDSIVTIGAVPIVLQIFKDVDRDTTTMRICNQYGILRINFGAISETTDFVDGVTHPNDIGGYKISMLIKSELPALIKTKGIERESLRGLQDVTMTLAPTNGSLLQWNATTEVFEDKTITALGTNFILNQYAGLQSSANFAIDGNGAVGSNLRIGTITGAGLAKLTIVENTINTNGITYTNNGATSALSPSVLYNIYGTNGGGIVAFQNKYVQEDYLTNGSYFSSYYGTLDFATNARTLIGQFNNTGLSIGKTGATVPLDVVGAITGTTTINAGTGYRIAGAATSRKLLIGNGTNFVQSTETWAVPGTSGNVLTSDGTNWTSAAPAGGGITVGTTTIASGTNTRVLYNNSGVVGEYTVTGTGTELMKSASPTTTGTLAAGNITATPASDNQNTIDVKVVGGNHALQLGSFPSLPQYGAMWFGNITPSTTNYGFLSDGANFTIFNGATLGFRINNASAPNAMGIDASSNVSIGTLAGTGSRAVLSDAGGVLSAPVSDRSVKQNIKPLQSSINTLMQLNPVSFEYIDGWKRYGQGTQIGFIAQEVQKVLPNSVFTTPSTGKLGYNKDDLIPLLVKVAQEQQQQINELKAEIIKLQNK